MSITFQCEHCRREVKAPDEAGGKRGKCPYCQQGNYIPAELNGEIFDLVPLDEMAERQQKAELQSQMEMDREILAETGGPPPVPLEHKEDLTSEDLHHFVINFCLDMAEGNTERARLHAEQLSKFGRAGFEAVEDILTEKFPEPALDHIGKDMLERFLTQLGDLLK